MTDAAGIRIMTTASERVWAGQRRSQEGAGGRRPPAAAAAQAEAPALVGPAGSPRLHA